MKPAALALFFALRLVAQEAAPPTDCLSPSSLDDPRCRRALSNIELPIGAAAPASAPVIRDVAPTAERVPRAAQLPPSNREPKPALSEFQKFVEQATGAAPPVFGQRLFEDTPTTFAPMDRVPVTPEYALGPGDQLMVRAWGAIDLSVSPTVDRSGAIYIPKVGEVQMAGVRFSQAQDYIRTAISRVFRNFDLSVTMGQLRSIQVFVTGQANRPGSYTISALSTLVNAVFASGGPNPHGSMRNIRLMRAGREVARFDLYDLLLRGDTSGDQRLLSGDVVNIPPAGPQVALCGSVNSPGIYELSGETGLAAALELAGGLSPVAARSRATVQRISGGSSQMLEAALDGGAAPVTLRNGDIVNVFSVVPRFEATVTLRGNVADPVRLPWRPGMRVRDLIPDRNALLSRNYWRERNKLDQRPVEAREAQPREEIADVAPQLRAAPEQQPISTAAAKPQEPGSSQSRIMRETASIAAVASLPKSETENRVERNPLEVNWSYAVIERLDASDLRTALLPFNLGKAVIDGDDAANLPLEPGDVVTIFSVSDLKISQAQQPRYVKLQGEFVSAGVYSVHPGETLRSLVQRAGGFTGQAYLFGSELVRESSRQEQQQRLDDFANSLERQAASSAANLRGSVLSAEEAAAANSQIGAQRELVEKLRQVRAQGRIVLDLPPHAAGAEALPELQLEDGDVFTVPSRPAFVNVVGSVYNSTSFLWTESRRLNDYLRAAGGPARSGDGRRTFLIRADGSVISKSWANGLGHGFDNLTLNPGDTVVVPEQINKTTFMKGLKHCSQIFAQLGLGAAAINVLR